MRTRSDLVLPMSLMFIIGTFGMNFQITIALIAKQVFHRGADAYRPAVDDAGGRGHAGSAGRHHPAPRPTRLFLIGAALAFSIAEMLAGLMPSFGLTAIALVPAGFTMITMAQSANATVQLGRRADHARPGDGALHPLLHGRNADRRAARRLGRRVAGPRWGLLGGGLFCLVATLLIAGYLARQHHVGLAQVNGPAASAAPVLRVSGAAAGLRCRPIRGWPTSGT